MTAIGPRSRVPRARSHRRARAVVLSLCVAGLAALAWASFVSPLPRLVYNPSDSVAVGWYRVVPREPHADAAPQSLAVGAIVLARLPANAAALAAQRGYLPSHIPLLKRVGAVAPQTVCIAEGRVRIDGLPVATVLLSDRMGRPLLAWPSCRRLRSGELFLLGIHPASFDSRYFGPVGTSAVIGVAHPLWPRRTP
jgi:conjugative transfer signal peptidase TraF